MKRVTPAAVVIAALLVLVPGYAKAGPPTAKPAKPAKVEPYRGLTHAQEATLRQIAQDTWRFYDVDVDPNTHLPLDNVTFAGGSPTPTGYGRYTSAANIGVYLWAVVAANDLHLIGHKEARDRIEATLTEVQKLKRFDGFLHQWYDTSTGDVIRNPGDVDCNTEPTPTYDNCYFISQVDNGWYASGLVVARSAFPELRSLADSLIDPMNFGIFYDNGPETHCNVTNGQPTGQMYGGYYEDLGPAGYHNGAFYSDPRISAYVGMGLHQMPGNVWWRTWRELPPPAPFPDCQATDPDFSWQGQWPMPGSWVTYTDPQSGQQFPVWEGHYVYPGAGLSFIPTWGGGMFEALMANEVVPETSWAPNGFGLADVRTVQVQMKYATEALHFPVWGLSPSSTPDDTGGYNTYGVEGQLFPPHQQLSQCTGCASENVVTPHASFLALDVAPEDAYANIEALRSHYPGIYGVDGFFDAVDPTTGAVGHRYLVLDQSMIMAALDNALENRALQRTFAADPVSWAARTYLPLENMFVG
jgi:hypothetical protein